MPSQPTIRTVVAPFLICLLYAPPHSRRLVGVTCKC